MVLFKKIACKGKYQDDQAISDVVAYITRPDKTPNGLIYGVNVDMQNIAESMIAVSKQYEKYSRLRLHHFIITFKPEYKGNFSLLSKILEEICAYIGRTYQIVAALHEDTQHPHIHFVFNAVSFVNGYKYHGGKEDYYELIEIVVKGVRTESWTFHIGQEESDVFSGKSDESSATLHQIRLQRGNSYT